VSDPQVLCSRETYAVKSFAVRNTASGSPVSGCLRRFAVLVVTFCVVWVSAQRARAVTLAWDPSPDTNVAGYYVHYGTVSGSYTTHVDTGSATTFQVTDLVPGTTYYFAVTAYNAQKIQSAPSGEIAYTAPEVVPPPAAGVVRILPAGATNRLPRLQLQVPANRPYVVLASEDLKSWVPIHQGVSASADWIEWSDPRAALLPQRFYRLMLPDKPLVPGTLSILPAAIPQGTVGLRPSVAHGQRYEIQASQDLAVWTTLHEGIRTSNKPMDFVDSQAGLYPRRFYRLALPDNSASPASLEIFRGGISLGARLRVSAWEGQHYRILASEDLATWTAIHEGISHSAEPVDLVDPEAGLHPRRFYRLVFD